jgi:hypothetical protein
MPATFPSKHDAWMSALMGVTFVVELGVVVLVWVVPTPPLLRFGLTAFDVALVAFLAWTMMVTDYTVAERELVVRCGPFRWAVPLAKITRVVPTQNPLSGPAWSLDRLAVEYGEKEIRISPVDKAGFLSALASAVPALVPEGDGLRRSDR